MLSTALQTAEQLVDTIRGLPAPPPPAAQDQAQVVQTGEKLLPLLGQARTDLAAFTESGIAEIARLTAQIGQGAVPAGITIALHELGVGFDARSADLGPLVEQLDTFRDSATATVAALTAEQVVLNGQLAGLAAQRDHWQAEMDSLKKQNLATAVLTGFFGPLAWAGSELASAIQYGKSTEAALAETTQSLDELSARAHALQAGLNSCTLLSTAAGQLGSSVQGLANAANLIRADLHDDAVRAGLANDQTARLFLASLTAAMTVLKNGLV